MDSSKIKESSSPRNEDIMLIRGDRVVLMFDNFQEYGWVRWVGRKNSHDSGSELMAEVEFVSFVYRSYVYILVYFVI